MTERQAGYQPPDDSSARPKYRLEPDEVGRLWIKGKDWDGSPLSHNLGPKDEAFAIMAAAMEAEDFGERG